MKTYLKIALISLGFLYIGCNTSETKEHVLYEKNFTQKALDLRIIGDTITKSIVFKTNGLSIPLKIKWLIGLDEHDCHKIAYLHVERVDNDPELKISNVSISHLPCAVNLESVDNTKFESMFINGNIEYAKETNDYTYQGNFVTINGLGEAKTEKIEY